MYCTYVPGKKDMVLPTEVSLLKRRPCYRDILTTLVQRYPHYRGVLTTGVSSLQRCPHYRGVLTTEVSLLQRCPHYRGVLTTEVSSLQRCLHNRGNDDHCVDLYIECNVTFGLHVTWSLCLL